MTFIPHSCNLPLEHSGSLLVFIGFKFPYYFSPTIIIFFYNFLSEFQNIRQFVGKIQEELAFFGGGGGHLALVRIVSLDFLFQF